MSKWNGSKGLKVNFAVVERVDSVNRARRWTRVISQQNVPYIWALSGNEGTKHTSAAPDTRVCEAALDWSERTNKQFFHTRRLYRKVTIRPGTSDLWRTNDEQQISQSSRSRQTRQKHLYIYSPVRFSHINVWTINRQTRLYKLMSETQQERRFSSRVSPAQPEIFRNYSKFNDSH